MNRIEPLHLPSQLPNEKAIRSFGQNKYNYDPEVWEFQYETNRYLEGVSNDYLIQRYNSIKENFPIYTENRRDVIPIISFLSSWYWYRKEHQTRYELFQRKISHLVEPPIPVPNVSKLYSTRNPNSYDKLFRYGERKFMKEFIQEGKIRISPALSYKDGAKHDPRTDDELNKNRWTPGKSITIQTKDGVNIPILGDMKSTVSAPNYYTVCFSTEFEYYMFDKFGYDTCIIIHNPELFEKRIKEATDKLLPNWYYIGTPVEYYDPYEKSSKNEVFMATISKEFLYAYQQEYRLLWDSLNNEEVKDYIYVQVGDLNDICELYHKK